MAAPGRHRGSRRRSGRRAAAARGLRTALYMRDALRAGAPAGALDEDIAYADTIGALRVHLHPSVRPFRTGFGPDRGSTRPRGTAALWHRRLPRRLATRFRFRVPQVRHPCREPA